MFEHLRLCSALDVRSRFAPMQNNRQNHSISYEWFSPLQSLVTFSLLDGNFFLSAYVRTPQAVFCTRREIMFRTHAEQQAKS
jgi:hypothetical protein